jgi:uncharacterized coiled-coil protein SlyX
MSEMKCYSVMLDDGPTTVVRYSDYEALAKRVEELEYSTELAGNEIRRLQKLLTQDSDEIKRLREALETLRSRCANNIPLWNDALGEDGICARCEQVAQEAVLRTPLEASDE